MCSSWRKYFDNDEIDSASTDDLIENVQNMWDRLYIQLYVLFIDFSCTIYLTIFTFEIIDTRKFEVRGGNVI